MNKLFFAACAFVWAGNVHADNLNLPVGDCVLSIPERQWCGILTVKENRSMRYIAGHCNDDGKMQVEYRAKSITLRGNQITFDNKYHVVVNWLSPLGKSANITYSYTDSNGEHSGRRQLSCHN